MSCGALVPRCEDFNLSSESHLPTNASYRSFYISMTTSIGSTERRRKRETVALLGPMSSD